MVKAIVKRITRFHFISLILIYGRVISHSSPILPHDRSSISSFTLCNVKMVLREADTAAGKLIIYPALQYRVIEEGEEGTGKGGWLAGWKEGRAGAGKERQEEGER